MSRVEKKDKKVLDKNFLTFPAEKAVSREKAVLAR
jgi:hypothetical protein